MRQPVIKDGSLSFAGRSLGIARQEDFQNPQQAEALIPQPVPYVFGPMAGQLMDAVNAGDNVLLVGHKGVGKTSVVEQVAARALMPLVRVNFTAHVTVSDLVGSIGITKDGTAWNDGLLPRAMRSGYWLLLDELVFAPPELQSVLFPVMERPSSLTLKESPSGEVVKAHPRFRLFATGNSLGGDGGGMYAGSQQLNGALLDRFSGHGRILRVEPLPPKLEKQVLLRRVPGLSTSLAARTIDVAGRLRSQLLPALSTREIVNWSRKTIECKNAVEAASMTFLAIVPTDEERRGIADVIQAAFGRRIVVRRQAPRTSHPTAPAPTSPTTSTAPTATPPAAPAETPTETPTRTGRTAAEVVDPAERQTIKASYKGNGGALSYQQIEERVGLRRANGMTAYRIVRAAT